MEESRPPVTNNEEKSSPAIERKQGFLVSFQDRLHELLGTEKLEKDEARKKEGDTTLEKDPSTGRFRRLWGKLFGSIASAELIEQQGNDTELPVETASLDQFLGFDENSERGLEDSTGMPEHREVESVAPEPPDSRESDLVYETQHEQNSTSETSHDDQSDGGYHGETIISHDDEEPLPFLQVTHEQQEVAPIIPPRWEGPTEDLPPLGSVDNRQFPVSATEMVTPILHYEDMQHREVSELTPTPARLAEERIRERDVQRRADEKREDQTRKLKHQIKKRQERTVEELKKEVKRAIPDTPAVLQSEKIAERTPVADRQIDTVTRETRSTSENSAAGIEKQVEKAVPAQEQDTQTVKTTVEKERPSEQVLERVVEAAEHGEPIEKRFEQRHEIKDSDSVTSSPVPIGAIMPSTYQKYAEQLQPSLQQTNRELAEKLAAQTKPHQTGELYASAVRWGFWSAIVLIVLGLIAYRVVG